MGRIAGGSHQKAVPHQEFLQQRADAFVIIDDQQVGVGVLMSPVSFNRA